MAKKVTTKKPLSGNKRSHALNATKQNKNLIFKKRLLMEIKLESVLEKLEQLKNNTLKCYFFILIRPLLSLDLLKASDNNVKSNLKCIYPRKHSTK